MIALEQQLPVLYGADCQARVQPVLIEGYQAVIDSVWPLLPGTSAAPQLHVVHSPFARPTSVHGDGGRHLIYDQYLGQVFNRLTRIEFAEAESRVAYSYAFKLYGQRYFIRGDFDAASAMANSSEMMVSRSENQSALEEDEDQFSLRTTVAWMQECFALCHELVHVTIEDGNAGELREQFEPTLDKHMEGISVAVAALSEKEVHQAMAASLAEDSARLAARRGSAVHDDTTLRLTDEELDHDIRRFEAQLEKVKRPDVVQEAMCDYYGAILAADSLGSADQGRPLVYAASCLGLLHLRLLQYLDGVADPFESSQDNFEQAILRASILRTGLSLELRSRSGGDGLAEEFRTLATAFNRKHSEIILDQVMTFDLARLATDMVARASSPSDQAAASRKLGLGPVPHLTHLQVEALLRQRDTLSKATVDGIVESHR
ncbi:MAG: hypothetical protein WBA00_05070 [Rhodococcus sp. (in: high G+C Gram-positive bacteria)]